MKVAADEVQRVLALPVLEDKPLLDMAPWALPGCPLPLNDVQRAALGQIAEVGGGFFPIGVGHGKTFIALLTGTVLGRDAVVFAPPHTIPQMRRELDRLRGSYRIGTVELVSYGLLSQPDGRKRVGALLRHLDPQRVCIVLDEAHYLRAWTSARTKRMGDLLRLLPDAPVVALSGTMTNRSLHDFAHLARWTLGKGSPVPEGHALAAWSELVDQTRDLAFPTAESRSLTAPLLAWGGEGTARDAFRRRMLTAPGVVGTSDAAVSASLTLESLSVTPSPDLREAVQQAIRYVYPDGREVQTPSERWLLLRTLSLGWWYELVWDESLPPEFFVARSRWGQFLRANRCMGLDSEGVVASRCRSEAEQGLQTPWAAAWRAWEPWADHPKPVRFAHHVDVAPIERCVEIGSAYGEPVIYWYYYEETAEVLESLGVKVYRAGEEISEKAHTCAASIPSHGTGLNLQQWRRAMVLELPTTGSAWEQLLGRLHRTGTPHDEIVFAVPQWSAAQKGAWQSAWADATYIEQTTGQRQKVCASMKIGL